MKNGQFDHDHYLNSKLLLEPKLPVADLNIQNLLEIRKSLFPKFYFLFIDNSGIFDFYKQHHIYLEDDYFSFRDKNIYLIRKTEDSSLDNTKIKLFGMTTLIIEDISVQKNTHNTFIDSDGNNEIYYFSNHISEQLFYNHSCFKVNGELKSYFITKENKQKHKNKVIYELSDKSILEHNSFSHNKYGQLQDDSIEVFHSKDSTSLINYLGLNYGHISTQINSVIGKHSEGSETHQKITHIALGDKSVINSKPNLMIANNDVVASHGNSIGKFSEEEFFYLSQRGISKERIHKILAESKLYFLLEKSRIKESVIKYYEDKIWIK